MDQDFGAWVLRLGSAGCGHTYSKSLSLPTAVVATVICGLPKIRDPFWTHYGYEKPLETCPHPSNDLPTSSNETEVVRVLDQGV